MKSIASIIAATVAALALTGCPDPEAPEGFVTIGGITSVPPSATGVIINDPVMDLHRVTMSVGVAIAARCADYCPDPERDTYQPCAGFSVHSDDATVLDTRTLYRGGRQPTEIVLVAHKVGVTTLRVQTSCGSQDYAVNVAPRTP